MRQIIYLTYVIRGDSINNTLNDIYRSLEGGDFHFGAGLLCYFSSIKEICVMVNSS